MEEVEVVFAHSRRVTLRVGDVFLKVDGDREIAEAALRPWTPVFVHGDLQITHVFVVGDDVAGVIDWSEAAPGDAMADLATLTLGHEDRLEDLLAGYGAGADRDVIRAWWSLRGLVASRRPADLEVPSGSALPGQQDRAEHHETDEERRQRGQHQPPERQPPVPEEAPDQPGRHEGGQDQPADEQPDPVPGHGPAPDHDRRDQHDPHPHQ
ncbi:phosphotransferase [Actinosynnema sp. CA-299493]